MSSRFSSTLIDALFYLLRVNDDDCSVTEAICPKRAETAAQTSFIEGYHG